MLGVYKLLQVNEYEKALLYERGRFIKVLEPGVYRLVRPFKRQEAVKVDMRLISLSIPSQEILTKDKLPVRLTLIAQYRVKDPATAFNKVQSYVDFLYEELQLALRALVGERTLEGLLDEKQALSGLLTEKARPRLAEYGLELAVCGVKDVILPGELKSIMTKVAEAEKSAQAALITAREELAATRCQLNTAKLLAENPAILKLKELQAMAEIAKKPGNNTIVLGQGPWLK